MAFGDTSSPTSAGSADHSALLSTHVLPHSASEPPKPSWLSSSSVHDAAAPRSRTEPGDTAAADAASSTLSSETTASPAPLPPVDREAFSTLRPTISPQPHETVAYTAAASARGRSLDPDGNFAPDHDPRRTSIASPASVIKNLPDAASKTLNTTVAAPVRTLDTIKSKLQSPSTDRKSKSEIPHSLDQVERDLRHNKDAPGNLEKPTKSGSFSSLLGRGKSQKSKAGSALMARGPRRADSAEVSGGGGGVREEEEEEDDEVVQQRIKEQQKRLEELDEAQTIGLLRTRQEAGVEEAEEVEAEPTSPTKSGWLVGLPLFGKGGSSKDEQGERSSSRRSSFRRSRSRRRQPTGEDDTDSRDGLRRANSEKLPSSQAAENGRQRSHTRSASASRAAAARSKSRSGTNLHPPRRQSLTWTSKLRTKIPIKEFPLQGSGLESEFNQECPLWARQPYKYMYFSYFGLSIGLYHLPRWAVSSILPSHRGRPDWSWKKATMVKLYRHGCKLTFRTRTSLGRDLGKEVPHSKTVRCKFTWVDPAGEGDVRGELRRAMEVQGVGAQRTCGFWYGDVAKQGKSKKEATPTQEDVDALRESEASLGAGSQSSGNSARSSQKEAMGGVGRPAEPGEKVLYHLHGGAYWIGTAHEKDVTAAVNTESLRYMAEIYKAREGAGKAGSSSKTTRDGDAARDPLAHSGTGSSSSSSSSSTSPYANKLLRSFSLDYRLCVPGRPRAGSYPAALLDALSGYLYLVRDLGFSPCNIIIAGDSAGGNLALALCRYLRDEGETIAAQPGALLLMSPWVDVSRSHSGPTGAPNLDSSVHTNQDSDIISSLIAFRNTAVSAFLGDLPARETYRNPYISPVSLQLPLERGGAPPFYGFHGFPKKIYITTGSAEISYDQHLTLAHRLAAGTARGRPVYGGDRLSVGCNAREMAERRDRPRPKEMLDEQQRGIGVTPMEEQDGFAMSVVGEQKGKRRMHASPPPEPEEKEDREVVLDEVKDAVHDYLLFKWFEPERSSTWRRIAKWIDEV